MRLNFSDDDTKISPFTAILSSQGFYKQQVINSPGGWAGAVALCYQQERGLCRGAGQSPPGEGRSGLLRA